MMLNRKLAMGLSICCCIALLVGCGGSAGRETVSVTGTVTLDGAPVAEAGVMFTGPDGGSPVTATTDASGKYTLNAVPGKNQVAVSKSVTTGETAVAEEDGSMPEDSAMSDAKTEWLVPLEYANYRTSGLEVDVSKGMGAADLTLVGK